MKADAYKIVDNVYWVGVLDWDIRDYHGYTLNGTTYNCYLVFGEEKVALIDNVYPGKSEQFWGESKMHLKKKEENSKLMWLFKTTLKTITAVPLEKSLQNSLMWKFTVPKRQNQVLKTTCQNLLTLNSTL